MCNINGFIFSKQWMHSFIDLQGRYTCSKLECLPYATSPNYFIENFVQF